MLPDGLALNILGSAPSPMQHEVLQSFFKSLLVPKGRAAIPGSSAVSAMSPGATASASGVRASLSGDSQTEEDADAPPAGIWPLDIKLVIAN